MIALARRAVPLGLLLVLVVQSSASAAEVMVEIRDNYFLPESITVRRGDTVTWTNYGTNGHTTGDAALAYWHSGTLDPGESYSFVFTAAGRFPYHCEFHGGMGGTVSVKLKAAPRSGPVGTTFVIKLATENATPPFVFDVQRKDPGGAFRIWMSGLISKSAEFDSAGMPTGTYQFRSRVRNTSTAGVSDWSVPTSIQVTG